MRYDINIDCQKNIIQCVIFKNMVELILNIIEDFTNILTEKVKFNFFLENISLLIYLKFILNEK